jgi:cell division protein FtsQ
MKRPLVITLRIAGIALLLALFALLGLLSRKARRERTCEGVRVEFSDSFNFVTEEDIKGYIDRYAGNYMGRRLDSLDLNGIENMLDLQSAVLKSEVYAGGDGNLHVIISQREPVLRFQGPETGFYIDDRGFIFPLQDNYTSMVPVIDGNIPVNVSPDYKGEARTEKEAAWIRGVQEMVAYMQGNAIWAQNIVQIHVDGNSDIILIPREGKEKFIFGGPDDAPAKFSRIEKYYQYIQPEGKEYTSVNVKYKGQIICK